MKLSELEELLADVRSQVGEADPEVRIADQPRYPFECSVQNIVCVNLTEVDNDAPLEELPSSTPEPEFVVYIAEGRQLNYLPSIARRALDW
jgi:hypothetical protein